MERENRKTAQRTDVTPLALRRKSPCNREQTILPIVVVKEQANEHGLCPLEIQSWILRTPSSRCLTAASSDEDEDEENQRSRAPSKAGEAVAAARGGNVLISRVTLARWSRSSGDGALDRIGVAVSSIGRGDSRTGRLCFVVVESRRLPIGDRRERTDTFTQGAERSISTLLL